MTKWGMPGVYTHAFMDGWSPGYLGSVAYNHNGMMRMYETQSGREQHRSRRCGSHDARRAAPRASVATATPCRRSAVARQVPARRLRAPAAAATTLAARRGARGGGRGWSRRSAAPRFAAGCRWERSRWRRRGCRRRGWRRRGAGAACGAPAAFRAAAGRAGDSDRPRRRTAARMVSRHSDSAERHRRPSRAATTRTTWRPACCPRSSSRRCSRTSSSRTSTSRRSTRSRPAATEAPYGYVIPGAARHDARRDAGQHPARAGHRGRHAQRRAHDRRRHVPGRLVRR